MIGKTVPRFWDMYDALPSEVKTLAKKAYRQWKTDPYHGSLNNGKLIVIDLKTGKTTSSIDIAKGVDQIAYDAGKQRIYCACQGNISVVEVTGDGVKLLGNVTTPKGTHTIAVDTKTHAVWTCYADAKESYLLKLVP